MWDAFLYNAVSVFAFNRSLARFLFATVDVEPSLTLTVPSVSITITNKKVIQVNVRQR
ncbi:hypothetical protein J2Z22_001693 [Paenibacillus forsythiae]|uniref:Uncharacterized protein n=1 Tax=Paenibacillus forsythiae TaxID=365616 RepID=A0ABU3H5S7_9BACL|nr:hypothetical protein [Paenibacillus forsythiae]